MIEKCYCSYFIGRSHENGDRRTAHTQRRCISRPRQILQAERAQKNRAQRQLLRLTQETTEKDTQTRELEEASQREKTQWAVSRGEISLTYKVLGRGAWGRVVEGIFRGSQEAVKEMHHVLVSQHNIDIFRREINTQWKCLHPNIETMIAATNHHRIPLIITELMELNEEEIASVAMDVAKGLNNLHQTKPVSIIHRDISSANILLQKRANSWTAKLGDFGSSNFIQKGMSQNPGAAIYAAPEASTTIQTTKVNIKSEA